MPTDKDSFGSQKRDWALLWRAIVIVFGVIGGAGGGIVLFAGTSFIDQRASAAAKAEIQPIAQQTAQEFAKYLLRTQYEGDQLRIGDREALLNSRVMKLEDANAETKNQMHRLELIIVEGFTKQGVKLSPRE